ncbi:hypothetical protein HPP92_021658 [Vanilla planifolia]|uniref:Uncharacterized protein n=1 Tax=Vanilla planifolia TaxID=51239 RepID=A0A835PVS9_VANPL|nr:hypothetical protein HPP92_021658 [Vanilla planifolia]
MLAFLNKFRRSSFSCQENKAKIRYFLFDEGGGAIGVGSVAIPALKPIRRQGKKKTTAELRAQEGR